ncbi:hypothetical protein ALI144C_41300 [Actinosynnema sp. ALI-1.44]|uniref:hypothetical protein n=1 Tax=Actinosynnema sp. ALI-1.44 TaxID=1933779 RepID=UPI00097CAE14|nr:hypothetical protein [Actinosynnema sp. ALI-1.44]ONI75183.1 hypothetical protein ALI144C_41300 [Actinosynnema sp. ALI-1.44]
MRVVQVLSACALVTLTACGQQADPAQSTPPAGQSDRIELAKKYAPLVVLGKDEKHRPIDATTFIANSELRWNRDGGCKDDEVDKHPTPQSLTDPNRYHRRESAGLGESIPPCEQSGREFNTTDPTRPYDNAELGANGYFLDANNDLHDKGTNTAPSYVQYVDGTDAHKGKTGYVYWFFFPWNQWTNPLGGLGGNHEGDWERVTVIVDDAKGPEAIVYTYHGHECRRPLTEVDVTEGRLTVYSAVGTHASYPVGDVKYKNKELPPGLKDWGKLEDSTSKTGEKWQIWNTLREVEREPWWGYAGGWGEVGGSAATNQVPIPSVRTDLEKRQTGPAGPSKHKNEQIRTEAFTDHTCQAPESGESTPTTESSGPTQPTTPVTVPNTKEGAIQRYEQALHAIGNEDTATLCEIAAPAMKTVPMPCDKAFQAMFRMIPAAKRKALQTATVDPAKVQVKSGQVTIPAAAIKAGVPFAERELGIQTLAYMNDNWFIIDT